MRENGRGHEIDKHFEKGFLIKSLLGGFLVLGTVGSLSLHSWTQQPVQAAERADSWGREPDEPLQPIKALTNLDSRKIELGRKLFDDTRLSHDNRISCSSCHVLEAGGADGKARSTGIHGAQGVINAPTVLNSGFNFSQFWDGRAESLERQVDFPVQSSLEMASTWPEVIGKLSGSPAYVRTFREIYGDSISREHVKNSIAEFERSLSTPNSRFDKFLRNDASALTAREQTGYRLFKSFGCASCHQGMNVGGNMYQKVGVMAPYFVDRGNTTEADLGRFNITGDPSDRYMFKVPSLRNIDLTPPYFHDGSAATLRDAVDMMAKYQLGHPLSPYESELIVDFLKTLTGELNGRPL